MTTINISNLSNPGFSITAQLAQSFLSKFLGLMFKKELLINQGIVLAENYESKFSASIHMLFMNFDICVVWLDKDLRVIDVKHAKKWHFAYFPKKAAQYVLELHFSKIFEFNLGDQLQFEYEKNI
ncbi:MAG: hypothetical protein C0417_00210 [Chlorobiaceae bacterium]|nr:hypothetical protein [Chlorobiaceae bacterium]